MKSGWKTTEFWISVAAAIGALGSAAAGMVPAEWATAIAAISGAFYALSRGLAKKDSGK